MINMPEMHMAELNGARLELYDGGNQNGEPMMFVHGGGSHEWHAMLQEPALADNFRLLYLHRRGNGNSELPEPSTTFQQQAGDFRASLNYLGIERAHFAGQSLGAAILLQYALDYPETVHSMAVLEPALPFVLNQSPDFNALQEQVVSRYVSGDFEGAIDLFFQEMAGADYRRVFDRSLPHGWFERLLGEAKTIFEVESPALEAWTFTRDDAARIRVPVLNMSGADTTPYLRECFETIRAWIPQASNIVLPGATHGIVEVNPVGAAREISEFASRHPLGGDHQVVESASEVRSI